MNPFLKDKTLGYVDFGNNIDIAMRLAREEDGFGKVKYFCSWQSAYPKYDPYVVGYGVNTILPNFEQVHSIFDMMPDVDIWMFPDLYMGDIQSWLRENGHLVFGAGRGEDMELHRDKMKVHLQELGLPVNKWESIEGLDALRKHLEEHNDLWVKTNMFRGAMESFHHDEYKLTKPRLDRFEHTLGVYKERQKFIVEASIDNSIDFAIDMITADGKYPLKSLMGCEVKNQAYAGIFTDVSKAPKGVLDVHDKLSKTLRQYQYRSFISLECRITKDGTAYMLDPCCRAPQPPSSLYIEMYDNFPQLVWDTASGDTPQIKSKYKYGVQLIIKSEFSTKEPQAIYFPDEIKNFVKVKNLCIQDGVYWYIPQEHEMAECAAVIGMGQTLKEAKKECLDRADMIKGDGIFIEKEGLDKIDKDIEQLVKFGIKIF
jgi:hypothetical protein